MTLSMASAVNEGVAPKDLLEGYSLEITAKDAADLPLVADKLPRDTRISVTFLPKEDPAKRLGAVRGVIDNGLRPVPHISARRITSTSELESYLGALAEMDATEEVFVVAGDSDSPMGPFEDALAVIRSGVLERFGVKHVGIGGYPDGHPKIDDAKLWTALCGKTAAIRDQGMSASILTQFGFDTDPVLRWLESLRGTGITAPVRLGVPGPASAGTLIRFAARCGVGASTSVMKKYGLSLTKLMQPAGPDKYVDALGMSLRADRLGDVGLHFYPFGGLEATVNWIDGYARQSAGWRVDGKIP